MSPDVRRKYEITEAEGNYEVASEVRDIGDKQVGPSQINPPGYSGVKVVIIPYSFSNNVITESVSLTPAIRESNSISESVVVTVT